MNYETILVEKSGVVARVILNRPSKLNAMNDKMLDELTHLCYELREDLQTRVVIFSGAGKTFSSGVDIRSVIGAGITNPSSMRLEQLRKLDWLRAFENLEQVTIAAVNGIALGIALGMLVACDFRVFSSDAKVGVPEAKIGAFCGCGMLPRLTRLIGVAKAKELAISCEMVNAEEALSIGLANKVVSPDQLMDAAELLASKITKMSPLAIRISKKIINACATSNLADPYVYEPELMERMFLSSDPEEGAQAFLGKRAAKFEH